MEARILNPQKALRTLRKTSHILEHILAPLSQWEAQTLRDGPDGWSILFIACHLRDYEHIACQRVAMMLGQENPVLPAMDNPALVERNQYAQQQLEPVLATLHQRRQEIIQLLEALSVEQWERTGVHPQQGVGTVLDVAVNTGLHDVDHIEQICRCIDSGAS